MNYSNVIFLINDQVRAVKVSYDNDLKNQYTIKKTFDHSLKGGDFVIVETSTRWNMTVCRVVEVDVEVDLDSNEQLGWVISKVDLKAHDEVKKQEEAAIEYVKQAQAERKKQELRENLDLLNNKNTEKLKSLPLYVRKDN